jgi:uncharacterized protein YlxW (UPF0749 family)
MTIGELQWLIGIAVTFAVAIGGISISAFRAVSARDDQLHGRVNRLREDVADNYVRRADLDSHMKRLDETLKEVRDDQKQIIRQIAALEAKAPRI